MIECKSSISAALAQDLNMQIHHRPGSTTPLSLPSHPQMTRLTQTSPQIASCQVRIKPITLNPGFEKATQRFPGIQPAATPAFLDAECFGGGECRTSTARGLASYCAVHSIRSHSCMLNPLFSEKDVRGNDLDRIIVSSIVIS